MTPRTYKALDLSSVEAQRAIANCRRQKPHVRMLERAGKSFLFEVPSRTRANVLYTVRLMETPTAFLLYDCTCPAGRADLLCVHVLGAAALWCAISHEPERARETQDLVRRLRATDELVERLLTDQAAGRRSLMDEMAAAPMTPPNARGMVLDGFQI